MLLLKARTRGGISSIPRSAYTNLKTPKIIQSTNETRPQHWYLYIIFELDRLHKNQYQ